MNSVCSTHLKALMTEKSNVVYGRIRSWIQPKSPMSAFGERAQFVSYKELSWMMSSSSRSSINLSEVGHHFAWADGNNKHMYLDSQRVVCINLFRTIRPHSVDLRTGSPLACDRPRCCCSAHGCSDQVMKGKDTKSNEKYSTE